MICQRLYEHLLEVTTPAAVSKMNRYNKLKAALRMLTLNAPRFGSNMVNDVAMLFESELFGTPHAFQLCHCRVSEKMVMAKSFLARLVCHHMQACTR